MCEQKPYLINFKLLRTKRFVLAFHTSNASFITYSFKNLTYSWLIARLTYRKKKKKIINCLSGNDLGPGCVRYTVNISMVCDSTSLEIGAAQPRSVNEMAPKSPLLCVNQSKVPIINMQARKLLLFTFKIEVIQHNGLVC